MRRRLASEFLDVLWMPICILVHPLSEHAQVIGGNRVGTCFYNQTYDATSRSLCYGVAVREGRRMWHMCDHAFDVPGWDRIALEMLGCMLRLRIDGSLPVPNKRRQSLFCILQSKKDRFNSCASRYVEVSAAIH